MKGQILGFDGETGAITAEGERYSFTLADWKGDRPPQPRDNVDFVAKDGVATDVYLVQSTLASAMSGLKGEGGGGSTGTINAAFFAERPQLVLEAIVIFTAIFLPYISAFVLSFTLLGFASVAGHNSGYGADAGMQILGILAYAFWLVPAGAAFAIFREFTGARMKQVELWLGILCVGSLVYYFLLTVAAGPGGSMLSLGVGAIVLTACGIGLIATSMGKLTRIPGL